MILADKIIDLRKKNGWSQEELAELMDVSRQSISKWEGAQSVPDMKRILKMSEVFGVSTDYLLKDDMETAELAEVSAVLTDARGVSMEEAVNFLDLRNKISGRTALGVMMCIFSPIALICLAAAQEAGVVAMSENAAAGLGLIILLTLIGGAVALFVTGDLALKNYEYMEKDAIETAYGVSGMVEDRRARFRGTHTRMLTLGIVLCVLATNPLFISMMFFGDNDLAAALSVGALLFLVGIGVFLIVRVSYVWDSFSMLLEEGDYSRENKTASKKMAPLAGIYWAAVLAVYLGISFMNNSWDRSWIIWPVAAVAYGAVAGIVKVLWRRG